MYDKVICCEFQDSSQKKTRIRGIEITFGLIVEKQIVKKVKRATRSLCVIGRL